MRISEENILRDIRKMLSDKYPTVDISMETYLEFGNASYLDMSSIDIVEFIITLEEKYNIIIDIDDRYYTIGDVVHGVLSYLSEAVESELEEKCESKL